MKQTYFLALLFAVLFVAGCKEDDDPNVQKAYHSQAVGASAEDLLAENDFDRLEIQLVAVNGYQLDATSITSVKSFLQSRLNKSGGIEVNASTIASPAVAPYSLTDVQDMEEQYRTEFNSDKTLSVWVFITDGNYESDENVLGIAYRNTSLCLFGEKIDQITGGFGQPSKSLLETTVLNHEFGHIMGLVNNGTDMEAPHQDAAHGAHCDNQDCLMYWLAETGDMASNLLGMSSPPDLDANCISDLRANGGK